MEEIVGMDIGICDQRTAEGKATWSGSNVLPTVEMDRNAARNDVVDFCPTRKASIENENCDTEGSVGDEMMDSISLLEDVTLEEESLNLKILNVCSVHFGDEERRDDSTGVTSSNLDFSAKGVTLSELGVAAKGVTSSELDVPTKGVTSSNLDFSAKGVTSSELDVPAKGVTSSDLDVPAKGVTSSELDVPAKGVTSSELDVPAKGVTSSELDVPAKGVTSSELDVPAKGVTSSDCDFSTLQTGSNSRALDPQFTTESREKEVNVATTSAAATTTTTTDTDDLVPIDHHNSTKESRQASVIVPTVIIVTNTNDSRLSSSRSAIETNGLAESSWVNGPDSLIIRSQMNPSKANDNETLTSLFEGSIIEEIFSSSVTNPASDEPRSDPQSEADRVRRSPVCEHVSKRDSNASQASNEPENILDRPLISYLTDLSRKREIRHLPEATKASYGDPVGVCTKVISQTPVSEPSRGRDETERGGAFAVTFSPDSDATNSIDDPLVSYLTDYVADLSRKGDCGLPLGAPVELSPSGSVTVRTSRAVTIAGPNRGVAFSSACDIVDASHVPSKPDAGVDAERLPYATTNSNSASVSLSPSKSCPNHSLVGGDVQMISHQVNKRKRKLPTHIVASSSDLPIRIKEEKPDDGYEVSAVGASKMRTTTTPQTFALPVTGTIAATRGAYGGAKRPCRSVESITVRSMLASARLPKSPAQQQRQGPSYRFNAYIPYRSNNTAVDLRLSGAAAPRSTVTFPTVQPPTNFPPRHGLNTLVGYRHPVGAVTNPIQTNNHRTTTSANRINATYANKTDRDVNNSSNSFNRPSVVSNASRALQKITTSAASQAPNSNIVVVVKQRKPTIAARTKPVGFVSVAPSSPSLRDNNQPAMSSSSTTTESVVSSSNGKDNRPIKVRSSNTKAALLTRKFQALYKRSILPRFVAPAAPPELLHLAPPPRLVCEACADAFVSPSGLKDHYDRKSIVVSFTCKCDKRPRIFYNMCSFAQFYQAHAGDDGRLQHSSYDACVMAMLPPFLMPHEYTSLKAKADEETKKETGKKGKTEASEKADGATSKAAASSVEIREVLSPFARQLQATSVNDFYLALERSSVRCHECQTPYKKRRGLSAHFGGHRQRGSVAAPNAPDAFKCRRCFMELPNFCSFRAHSRIHDKSEPYVCPECGAIFRTSRDVFMTHVKKFCLHFSRRPTRQCPMCRAVLPSVAAETAVAHLAEKHAVVYYKCGACTLAFPSENGFRIHRVQKHRDGAVVIDFKIIRKCPICNVVEGTQESFTTHLGGHVAGDDFGRPCAFRCLVCRKGYAARADLTRHMKESHPTEIITGQMCEICGAVCDTMLSLYRHTFERHDDFFRELFSEKVDNRKTSSASKKSGANGLTGKGKESKDVVDGATIHIECDRCQMIFNDNHLYKGHLAKHRFLESKKKRVSASKVSPSPSQGKGRKRRKVDDDDDAVMTTSVTSAMTASTTTVTTTATMTPSKIAPTPSTMPLNMSSPTTATTIKSSPTTSTTITPSKTTFIQVRTIVKSDGNEISPKREIDSSVERKDDEVEDNKDVVLRWFSCHLCEKTFRLSDDLQRHLKDRHAGKSRQHAFICWICRDQSELKSYPKAGMLIKHLKTAHKIARKNVDYTKISALDGDGEDGGRKEEDSAETSSVAAATSREAHVRRVRVEGDASYSCAKCDFSCAERQAFLDHIRRHRKDGDEGHQCPDCGLCFVVRPSLRRHLFAVHRVRDFERYQTENGIALDETEEVGSGGTDDRFSPLSDAFARRTSSGAAPELPGKEAGAAASSSPETPEKEDPSSLECNVCYRSFDDQPSLRQHMRVHGMAFIQGTRRNNLSRRSVSSENA